MVLEALKASVKNFQSICIYVSEFSRLSARIARLELLIPISEDFYGKVR